MEILATLRNSVALIVLCGFILFESLERLRRPVEVHALPTLLVAAACLAVNLWSVVLLRKGSGSSLNLKAAYLEVLSDALTSFGVLVAAARFS